LLVRIIESSCPPDGIILDPFCGSGTTITAAQARSRRWIGIDQSSVAIDLVKQRLSAAFRLEAGRDYTTIGESSPRSPKPRRKVVAAHRNE
jgi:DNA modification methylase